MAIFWLTTTFTTEIVFLAINTVYYCRYTDLVLPLFLLSDGSTDSTSNLDVKRAVSFLNIHVCDLL